MATFEKSKDEQIQISVRMAIEEWDGGQKTEPLVFDIAAVDSETYIVLRVLPAGSMVGTVVYLIPILSFLEEPIEQIGADNDG